MPFKYKRKEGSSERVPFTAEIIKNAVTEIKGGGSIRKTAIKYNIDRSTLRRYLNDGGKVEKIEKLGSQYKSTQIFNQAEEKLLVNYLITCSKMNYGLSRKAALTFVYDFAKANEKKIPNSWLTNNSAGNDWLRGFFTRNFEISLRTPEATSLSRATSFNRKNVSDFFENWKKLREKFKFEPQDIYNCDETGCTTVQKCPKVMASKKDRQVGQVTSAERGTLVTVCFTINAIGNSFPPFFVFPRVKYNEAFVSNGPEGSDGDSYPSGWMTTSSFLKYLQHFVKHSHSSLEHRTCLIMDNHESHVAVDVIYYAKKHGVSLLMLPPHCSNKMQPLDITVFSPFKTKYNAAMSNWMISNPGKTVTIYNIPEYVTDAMPKAFTQPNIISSFKNSGIHPFNPEIFSDEDFMMSEVTNRPVPENVEIANRPVLENMEISNCDVESENVIETATNSNEQYQDRCAAPQPIIIPVPSTSSSNAPGFVAVTPEMIKAYPKAGPRKTNSGRQPGKTRILTETPEIIDNSSSTKTPEKNTSKTKKESALKSQKKSNKQRITNNAKGKKLTKKSTEKIMPKKHFKRKILQSSSESESDLETDHICDDSDSPWDQDGTPDKIWFCFICETDQMLDMRLCVMCKKYVHESCVGLTRADKGIFNCSTK